MSALLAALILAQPPSAATLRQELERLRHGADASVLYVAAHPDDENTRLLAWLVGERHARAVYVSLTRGDGGQNLVGKELGPLLGLIRTHELLAARATDGAEQRFTRAVDFGYSKSAAETFRVWDREAVLADLVRVIRDVRPHVIVARFSTQPPNHGHHTASALLAREAFDAARDPARFPESGPPHAARRLVENTSHWRFQPGEDLSRYARVDVGGFSALRGRSWGEVAAESRTMHKSQGFGTAPQRGSQLEYFEHLAGDPAPGDPFADLPTPPASPFREALDAAIAAHDPRHPEALIPLLLAARPHAGPHGARIDGLLVGALGLVVEARSATPSVRPGESLEVTLTALTRTAPATLASVTWRAQGDSKLRELLPDVSTQLAPNGPWTATARIAVPAQASPSTGAALPVDPTQPLEPSPLTAGFEVIVSGHRLALDAPVRFAWVDPVHGERAHPVEILPAVTVTPRLDALLVGVGATDLAQPGVITLDVAPHAGPAQGTVTLRLPKGWGVAPLTAPFDGPTTVAFAISAPTDATAAVEAEVQVALAGAPAGPAFARAVVDHPHVPRLSVVRPSRLRVQPIALAGGGVKRVGVLPGAGDELPTSLTQAGYAVAMLEPDALELSGLDAVVIGIRALNVNPALSRLNPALLAFIERGGVVLMQYATSNRMRSLGTVPLGPFPFTIDQDRVTDESAPMVALDLEHPAHMRPNRLGPADAAGWVQERGLYFARTWDPRFTPIFRLTDTSGAADAAESDGPFDGAVLVGRHGRGAFVYTGLAFFRQLPAGVPGAYRLLANLLALGTR